MGGEKSDGNLNVDSRRNNVNDVSQKKVPKRLYANGFFRFFPFLRGSARNLRECHASPAVDEW